MDGLIGLLIFIGILAATSSSKKKARQEAQRSFGEAFREESVRRPQSAPQKAKIPYFPEESEKQPAQKRARENEKKAPLTQAVPPETAHDEPEGSVSTQGVISTQGVVATQGESAAEHAQHRRRIAREEELLNMEREALDNLRKMNLEKLRAAVVMREVLDKPVSLRPRGRR